jgi:hypothetical protein
MPTDPNTIAERGNQIYATKYQQAYEAEHPGQYIAIDVQSEEAIVAPTPEDALRAARSKNESSMFHLIKIGSPGVFRVGYLASGA